MSRPSRPGEGDLSTAPLRTPRMALVLLPLEALRGLLAGDATATVDVLGASWPDEALEQVAGVAAYRVPQLEADPSEAPWLLRAMVLPPSGGGGPVVIGHAGCHARPDASGMVEIGYSVRPQWQRQGYAREAARALLGWAGEHGASTARASISPGNVASLALVAQLGMVVVGSQWDERDGEELVLECPLPLRD